MKLPLVIPLSLGLAGIGLAAGLVIGAGPDGPPLLDEIRVQDASGAVRAYTPEEAAARIETLEGLVRRSRERNVTRFSAAEEDDDDLEDPEFVRPPSPLLGPNGKPYTPDELRVLARGSDDPEQRRAAIRALRWNDSEEARITLQAIFGDPETPPDLRLLSAQMLARPPHRDKLPDTLLALLADEKDPEVRETLLRGVVSLRDRGAWMKEISSLLADETDPDARALLLSTVARTRWDPAAREELLHIAASPGASAEERRAALAALSRGSADAATLRAVAPLLEDADPVVRAHAMRILGSDRRMTLGTLRTGLEDDDAGVRAIALGRGLKNLGRLWKDKKVPREGLRDTVARVVDLAASDEDPHVRRAAISGVWNLPKGTRDDVLRTGRDDGDLYVRLTAYANSPPQIARSATDQFLGALDAPDPALRDYAYQQLRRLHRVSVPYSSRWNPNARSEATEAIRRELAGATR